MLRDAAVRPETDFSLARRGPFSVAKARRQTALEDTLAEAHALNPWVESRAFLASMELLTVVPLVGLPALMLVRTAGAAPLAGLVTVMLVAGTIGVTTILYI